MADFPTAIDYSKSVIDTLSLESLGSSVSAFSIASATWPTANTAIYIPVRVAYPIIIAKMFWLNGGTVNGNVDAGIYNSEGNRLVSSGSTLQATINVVQSVDITDTLLLPGLYYMALASDSVTATFQRLNTLTQMARSLGVYSQATAFALPATATFAGTIVNPIPFIAMTTKTVI